HAGARAPSTASWLRLITGNARPRRHQLHPVLLDEGPSRSRSAAAAALHCSIVEFRKRLQHSVCSALSEDACTRGWLATHQHLALRALLLALFPAPAS